MSYQAALKYLNSFTNYERLAAYPGVEAFSLERVRALLSRLGDPHLKYPSLHVAGTKGKGSTCVFAASILSACGLRTGLYTSPHLWSFHERIRVDGVPIGEGELAEVVARVREAVERMGGGGRALTYFEVTTACAFLYFARRGVEAAVVEVGLGGRLDATNVLAPEVTAVTPVSFDHMELLGDTLEAIAGEKAGILKPGTPVVMAPQAPEAERVIREAARAVGAPLHTVAGEVRVERARADLSGTRASLSTPERFYPELKIPLLGRHQLANCSAAVRMAELLAARLPAVRLTPEAVRRGVEGVSWPGRCQLVDGRPPVLLDGAQNAESARALVETVEELFPKRAVALVVGCSTGKDLQGMAGVWGPWAGSIIVSRAETPRAETAERVAAEFRKFRPDARVEEPVPAALRAAVEEAGPDGLVVVTGSLFVVAEALEASGAGFFSAAS